MPEARNITMEKRQISFSPPDITEAEVSAVADVLRSDWITTGPRTKEFEKRIAKPVSYTHLTLPTNREV